jgi:hypothetical protein
MHACLCENVVQVQRRESDIFIWILLVRNAQHAWSPGHALLPSKWKHDWGFWRFGSVAMLLASLWNPNPLPQLPCNCSLPSERLRRLHKSCQASHLYSPLTKTRMVMDMRHGRTQLIRSNQRLPETEEHMRRRPRTVQLAIASPNSIIQDSWLRLLLPI